MPDFVMPIESNRGRASYAAMDPFTRGYVAAIFFASTGEPDDEDLETAILEDLAPDTLEVIECDCQAFQDDNRASLDAGQCTDPSLGAERAGYDFWMTRSGAGVGFWDGRLARTSG